MKCQAVKVEISFPCRMSRVLHKMAVSQALHPPPAASSPYQSPLRLIAKAFAYVFHKLQRSSRLDSTRLLARLALKTSLELNA